MHSINIFVNTVANAQGVFVRSDERILCEELCDSELFCVIPADSRIPGRFVRAFHRENFTEFAEQQFDSKFASTRRR